MPINTEKHPEKAHYKIPIRKVRIAQNIVDPIPLRQMPEKHRKFTYAEPGNNYKIAVYGDAIPEKSGKKVLNRDFEVLNFFQAVKRAKQKERVIKLTKGNKPLLYVLTHNDVLLVFKDHPDELQGQPNEFLSKRLFRVIKFDREGSITLGRHQIADMDADRAPSVQDVDSFEGEVIRCNPNTIKAVRVRVNELGEITFI